MVGLSHRGRDGELRPREAWSHMAEMELGKHSKSQAKIPWGPSKGLLSHLAGDCVILLITAL